MNAPPQFRVLSNEQIEEIFHAVLDVLMQAGTRVYGEEGLALLREAGCLVSDEDAVTGSARGLVRIPAWLIKDALNTTPSRVVVAGRDRGKRILLEKDKFYFGRQSHPRRWLSGIGFAGLF